jgi:transposase
LSYFHFSGLGRAARGYRTAKNFIAIAYLRLSRLKNLPAHPFTATAAVK